MKLIYLFGLGFLVNAETHYVQVENIEYDRVEIIYLPNNTCQIKTNREAISENYSDYVRACLNNRHLRIKIANTSPN